MILQPLRTERIDLVPFSGELAEEMYLGLQAPQIYEFIADSAPPSVHWLRRRYERLANTGSPDGAEEWLNWALRVRNSRMFVGYMQATVRERVALVAYVLFPAAWGAGYASEALNEVLRALSDRGVNEFVATVHTDNARSIRVLERARFTVREFRRNAETIRGISTDEYEFVRFAPR
ncbi:MAG: GNAT family N-acetyltransferase [Vulcanimicrobiaceae bacterium]